MRLILFSLLTFLFITAEAAAQRKSWANQLRSAKRKPSAKRVQHGNKGYFRAPLIASESGEKHTASYSMPHQPESYRPNGCYGAPPGSYGNPAAYCRAFHVCQPDGRFDVMDCPASLRFNNYLGVCDWPDKVDPFCNPIDYPTKARNDDQYRYSEYSAEMDRHRERDMSYAAAETFASRTDTLANRNVTEKGVKKPGAQQTPQTRTMKEIQERLMRVYEDGMRLIGPQLPVAVL